MRIGVVLLPQQRWAEASARWQAVENMGFDHAWTYDHLAWRTLADEPWFATVPTLTAAAVVTSRIRLGTWVASPNYRHPVTFAKELMSLDDVSQGRFELGIGAGGIGFDATVLGGEVLPARERVDRLAEFTELLDRLLTSPSTTWRGDRYEAVEARMVPGCVQRPRLPFVVAANGPRTMRVAVRFGQGWATTGPEGVEEAGPWWDGVATLAGRMDDALSGAGREPATLRRYLSADSPGMALASRAHFAEVVGRARELGFTDVVTHWPRAEGVWAGDEAVLEQVAGDLEQLRAR
jgi:alkanesulfonate monooxygenase SsuD/methylene tetrahydromethanopterin reductase-like flavin-dependent oxidoreductase (luciferase family)